MKSMTEYPVYRVNYSMEDDQSGIHLVSIVDDPAIQLNSITLSDEEIEVEVFLSSEDEMRVVGPALVPDKPIFRKSKGGYFIYFTKEDIKNLVKKFNRTGGNNRIGLDHNGSVSDAYINEQWIVENPEKDKSSFYNLSVESGTWMLDVQITDQSLWAELKKKKTLGFSIEALLGLKINEVSMVNEELNENEVVDTNVETIVSEETTNDDNTSEVDTTENETVEEVSETIEEVVETTEEADFSGIEFAVEDTVVAEPAVETPVDLEAKISQMELMISELVSKISTLEEKSNEEYETRMKNEAVMELSRHSKTYNDVMSGEEEFRNLKKDEKTKYLIDRVEQIAKIVSKNK